LGRSDWLIAVLFLQHLRIAGCIKHFYSSGHRRDHLGYRHDIASPTQLHRRRPCDGPLLGGAFAKTVLQAADEAGAFSIFLKAVKTAG